MTAIRPIPAAALATALVAFAVPASAQTIQRIGEYNDWSAYVGQEEGAKVCFVATSPTKSEGDYTRRGRVFAIVTVRPAENRGPEVSFVAGYPFKEGSTLDVDIDGSGYRLFTRDDTAWLPNTPDVDEQMVQAMKRGLSMVAKGTSSRGTVTTDSYSLRGFTAAYGAMEGACR